MDGTDPGRRRSGFKSRTPLDDARETLRDAIRGVGGDGGDDGPLGDPETVSVSAADGRVLAEPVTALRDVPHYERAAMDGYAVRAADTFGASDRSPEVLRTVDGDGGSVGSGHGGGGGGGGGDREVRPGTAARVHTGSAIPTGADAVVKIERVEELGDELEVGDAVAEGENVAPVGEDVEEGAELYEAGHRLRPSDLGLLRSVGYERVRVAPRPTVGVIPTGEELVGSGEEPGAGEVVETNGLTVSRLVERWGGRATYRDVVTDDPESLRVAIERDLTKDVVVTTGGSSVGERDLLPEVIDDLGEVLVHGVALKPGHPVCLGLVEGTPVLALPGYPVACIVNAVQFLRPVLRWLEGTAVDSLPTVRAALDRKIASEPGTRTFARVSLERRDGTQVAVPTRASGAGVLSSVALADGWVVVDDDREGIPEGAVVDVELWESNA